MPLFQKKPPLSVGILFLSGFCHLVAFFQMTLAIQLIALSLGFKAQFLFFLLLSLGASVVMFLNNSRIAFRIMLILRLIGILFLSYLVYPYSGVQLSLFMALLLEIAIYEPYYLNVELSAFCLILVLTVQYAIGRGFNAASRDFYRDLLSFALYTSVVILPACLITRYREEKIIREREVGRLSTAVTRLTNASTGFMEYASAVEERSTISERHRIAGEIHDVVGYTMTNLMMMMEAAMDLAPTNPEKFRSMLSTAREQAELSMKDIRQALHILRSEEVQPVMGIRAIQRLVNIFRKATGISVHVEYSNLPWTCGEEIDSAMYHTVQESITNAFRHGKATEIRIIFWQDDAGIRLSIRDNGSGVVHFSAGLGLTGMKERLEKLKGRFVANNVVGGFEILAFIPKGEKEA